jgi:hypothetical protein
VLDQHGGVSSHGERVLKPLPDVCWPDADEHNFSRYPLLFQADSFLNRDLIEGVDNPLNAIGLNPGSVWKKLELDLPIRDADARANRGAIQPRKCAEERLAPALLETSSHFQDSPPVSINASRTPCSL